MSLLALKLLGNERLSHDAPYSLDRALGLFAGLNVLPKNATLSSYSYRVRREQNLSLLRELASIFQSDDTEGDTFNMDFKAIPHWGDESVLENNWAGMRGKRIKSLLALLVQNPDTGILAYCDAGIPQKGLAREIWRRRRLSTGSILGLPGGLPFLDFLFQYSLNPILCQRATVSGLTIDSADCHLGHSLDIHTQKILSVFFSFGRGFFLYNEATCCLRHRFQWPCLSCSSRRLGVY